MRKQIIIKGGPETANSLGWILDKQSISYIRRTYGDKDMVWYPISLGRLVYEIARNGQFTLEVKKPCWLGEPGDVVTLIFK